MALFFPATHRITRHRNWVEKLDRDMALRSRTGIFSFLVMLFLLAFLLRDQLDNPLLLLTMVTVLLMAPVRFFWVWRFDNLHGRGAAYWRDRFFLITLVNSLLWNLLAVWVYQIGTFNLSLTILLIFQTAMAAGSAMLYAPFKQFGRLYLALLLLPAAFILLMVDAQEFWVVSLGLVLLMAYLQIEQGKISDIFWAQSNQIFTLQQEVGIKRSKAAREGYKQNINHMLIANMASMLDEPVKRLNVYLEPLQQHQANDEQKQSVKLAMRTCDSIGRMLADVQAYSALRNKQFFIDRSTISLSRISDQIMDTCGPVAHEKDVELSYLENFDVPERVVADGPHLITILSNLLTLCIGASRPGELSFKLSCLEKENIHWLKWQMRTHLGSSQDFLQDLEDGRRLLTDQQSGEELLLRNLPLAISLKLLSLMQGQLDFRFRQDDSFELLLLVPLEVASQQQRQFVPERTLASLSVNLLGMPSKGGKALLAELQSWRIPAQCFQELEQLETEPANIIFANLPVSLNNDDAERYIRKLKDYCLSIEAQLLLYCSYPHQQSLKEELTDLLVVPKPVSRSELHQVFLAALLRTQANNDSE